MRKALQGIVILILAVTLVGCGSGTSEPPKEQPSSVSEQEKAESQNPAESEAPEQVDEVPLAAGFPQEVPLIEGQIVQSEKTDTVSLKDGSITGVAYVTSVLTPKSVSEAAEFYKSKFTQIKDQMDGDSPYFNGLIGKHDVIVYIGSSEGKTEVQVQVNLPK